MKYPVNSAHGDAGEFFFAYKIAQVLKWPCRLLDIDIGIDAQVEVINPDRSSTGRFVAFQIKATDGKKDMDHWYVSETQLAYWHDLDLPVFVVLVNLSTRAMFLHRVDAQKSYAVTQKGFVRIDFDLAKDRFSRASATLIARASQEAAFAKVRNRLSVVLKRAESIKRLVAGQEENPDPDALIEVIEARFIYKQELAQAEALVDELGVGRSEFNAAEKTLTVALQKLRYFIQDWGMDHTWADRGDIARFVEEG